MTNPYSGANLLQFFVVLWKRLSGQIPLDTLAADEVQLLALLGITFSTSLLGTFLTVRKMTMLANSLSHTSLLGVVVCALWTLRTTSEFHLDTTALITASILTAFITLLSTEGLRKFFKLQEDAAIGLVFTTLFALGITLVSLLARNTHLGVDLITGNIDGVDVHDLAQIVGVASCNACAGWWAFRPWSVMAFDPQFASASGINYGRYHLLLMGMTAVTLVASIRAVGVLLVLSLLVTPTLIALQWTYRLASVAKVSIGIGMGCSLLGVALSRAILSSFDIPLSTGGIIVALMSVAYILILTFRPSKGLMT